MKDRTESQERQDRRFMRRALRLAAKGVGRTSPNPAVGAVVVRGERVVGQGYHGQAGTPHAEVVALREAGQGARGATLYVTLEPCCHHGRTPPCVDAIVAAGIRRVVAGMTDPNPRVRGRGIRKLRQAGITVTVGPLREDCEGLNEDYRKFIVTGRPLVILKLAASLDGRIAAPSGDSRWITGEVSRRYVHRLRNQVDAVLVGAGTIARDNPRLTCRLPGGRNPVRVVLDGRLRCSPRARVFSPRSRGRAILITSAGTPSRQRRLWEKQGVEVITFSAPRGKIFLPAVFAELGRREIKSVMIEGGTEVATAALRQGVVDKVIFFYAPKLLGGNGREMVGPLPVNRVAHALGIHSIRLDRVGDDVKIEGYCSIRKERTHADA